MNAALRGRSSSIMLVQLLLLTVAAAATACSDSEASRTLEVSVRDSAGVRIVESPAEAQLPLIDIASRPPLLRIGALDGAEGEVLYQVIGASLLSGGRLAVGNAGSHQIRFYDANGTLASSVGGEGDGPGEFRDLTWVGPAGADSVAAFDDDGRRVTVFDADGVLARTFRLAEFRNPGSEEEPVPRSPMMEGRLDGGSFVVGTIPIVTTGPTFTGIPDDSVNYYFIGDDGASDRGPIAVPASESWVESTESTASVSSVPLGRRTDATVGADVLWIGMTDSNDILGYGEDGALRLIIRRDVTPRSVTPADIERYKNERMELAADNPGWLDFLRENFERVPFASHHPLFSSIAATEDGGVWIEEYAFDSDESIWTVYGPDGQPVGSARLPPDARILRIAGDSLVLRRQDELSVEYVEIYGVGERGGGEDAGDEEGSGEDEGGEDGASS